MAQPRSRGFSCPIAYLHRPFDTNLHHTNLHHNRHQTPDTNRKSTP
jgi:hypothetical protein